MCSKTADTYILLQLRFLLFEYFPSACSFQRLTIFHLADSTNKQFISCMMNNNTINTTINNLAPIDQTTAQLLMSLPIGPLCEKDVMSCPPGIMSSNGSQVSLDCSSTDSAVSAQESSSSSCNWFGYEEVSIMRSLMEMDTTGSDSNLPVQVVDFSQTTTSSNVSTSDTSSTTTTISAKRLSSKQSAAMQDWGDWDVPLGRTSEVREAVGNIRFRAIIDKHRPAYQAASQKADKTRISTSIVRMIYSNGGRFLDRKKETGDWYEISSVKALAKVSQSLRNGTRPLRKESLLIPISNDAWWRGWKHVNTTSVATNTHHSCQSRPAIRFYLPLLQQQQLPPYYVLSTILSTSLSSYRRTISITLWKVSPTSRL